MFLFVLSVCFFFFLNIHFRSWLNVNDPKRYSAFPSDVDGPKTGELIVLFFFTFNISDRCLWPIYLNETVVRQHQAYYTVICINHHYCFASYTCIIYYYVRPRFICCRNANICIMKPRCSRVPAPGGNTSIYSASNFLECPIKIKYEPPLASRNARDGDCYFYAAVSSSQILIGSLRFCFWIFKFFSPGCVSSCDFFFSSSVRNPRSTRPRPTARRDVGVREK